MDTAFNNKSDIITISERAVMDRSALSRTKEYIFPILSAGHILLVYRKGTSYGADLRHKLRKSGYRVSELMLKEGDYSSALSNNPLAKDESFRLVVGAGGSAERAVAGYLAHSIRAPYVFFLVEPTSDMSFSSRAYLGTELVSVVCTPPTLLIAELAIIPERIAIAEGMALLYARLIGVFDRKYSLKACGSYEGRDGAEATEAMVKAFFAEKFNPSSSEDQARLTECLIRVSLALAEDNTPFSAVELFSRLINVKCGHCASAPLIAAHTLYELYLFWLSAPVPDLALPPDRCQYLDKLYSDKGHSRYYAVSEWSREDYSRVAYVTEELRNRLREELCTLSPSPQELIARIKEVFPDSGYHIKDVTDFKELMGLLALTAELTEEISLLKFIDRTGVLWHYVRDLE